MVAHEMTLSGEEIRVIGCLLEKAVTTPDQYPLTLNAVTLACNQKSSREPVMNLVPGVVERTLRMLEEKHLISRSEGKNGISKYSQRFCNTLLSDRKFDSAQYAVLCLLLLRGAQTPGELRARSARMHSFDENDAVKNVLQGLMDRESGALLARLPRQAGRKDHCYMHLFAGDIESVIEEHVNAESVVNLPRKADKIVQLEARVERLENALRDLATRLGEAIDLDDSPAETESCSETLSSEISSEF